MGQDGQQSALRRQRAASLVLARISQEPRQRRRVGPLHQHRGLLAAGTGEATSSATSTRSETASRCSSSNESAVCLRWTRLEPRELDGHASAEEATAAREPQLVAARRSERARPARLPRAGRAHRGRATPPTSATRSGSSSRSPSMSRSRCVGLPSRSSISRRRRSPDRERAHVRARGRAGCGVASPRPSRPRRCRDRGNRSRASTRGCGELAGHARRARSGSRQKFAVSYQRYPAPVSVSTTVSK